MSEINRGARRSLLSVVIELDRREQQVPPLSSPATAGADQVRRALLHCGLWTAFRTRPFNRVPTPDTSPAALFVTALDSNPLAVDPVVALTGREDDFEQGLQTLARLGNGVPLYVCARPGQPLPLPTVANLTRVDFRGPHPAGLPGVHISLLHPGVSAASAAWHIGYQDVAAIGSYFRTGKINTDRVIALGGPAVREPRLLRTRLGADLTALLADELTGPATVLSGSALAGRETWQGTAFLGRYHNQVTALAPAAAAAHAGLGPLLRALAADLFGRAARPARSGNARPSGMLPLEAFDAVWPLDQPPTPLLRALLTGDSETAKALGVQALAEEDLALCGYVCPARIDYGAALRDTLRDIEKAT